MSVINVSLEDTFEQWRVKTNAISSFAGDQASLQTSSTNLVAAINEVFDSGVKNGVITTNGDLFQVNIDPTTEDGPELTLDENGNLIIAGTLYGDVQGDVTGNADTASKLKIGRIISITGDATYDVLFDGSSNVTADLALNPTGVVPGTYCKFTVDGSGRAFEGLPLQALDVSTALGYVPASTSGGYNNPTWITALDGSKILSNSSISVANVTVATRLLLANGSATIPSISFSSDTDQNTGIYWGGDGYTFFTNNGVKSGEIQPGGHMIMVGNVSAYSDISLKKNIETIKGALAKVNRLRGVYYDTIDTNERNIGVIAQEVNAEAPELIRIGSDGKLTVAYGNMGALLLQAINELTERVEAIEKRL